MANKNIIMKEKTASGYDNLYPAPSAHAATHTAGGADAITVATGNIASGAVTTDKLSSGAVTAAKCASEMEPRIRRIYYGTEAVTQHTFPAGYSPAEGDIYIRLEA